MAQPNLESETNTASQDRRSYLTRAGITAELAMLSNFHLIGESPQSRGTEAFAQRRRTSQTDQAFGIQGLTVARVIT